jgi:hypothetical protein
MLLVTFSQLRYERPLHVFTHDGITALLMA